jgi:hypothetical protein
MDKVRLIVLTNEQIEQLNKQKSLEKEIENQGIVIGWKSADIKIPLNDLKNQIIVKYKTTKVMRVKKGNILLCKLDGCYNPSISYDIYLCKSHSENKILKQKYCTSKTICISRASFGYTDDMPLCCKQHSSKDMRSVTGKRCNFPNCETRSVYGIPGKKPEFCAKHKTKDMIEIKSKKCMHPQCNVLADYGHFGETDPRYCRSHQLKCSFEGCEKIPTYGIKNESLRYCKSHKLPEMKNINNQKCCFEGCETVPSFGHIGEKAMFCKKHMDSSMVNVYLKRCSFKGCNVIPTFGVLGGEAICCKEHKLEDMKDVTHKLCSFNGCLLRSSYGHLFSKIHNHCVEHSTLNEYNKSKRFPRCSNLGCSNPAIYINPEDKSLRPIRCIDHKKEPDIELIRKACLLCLLNVYIPDNKDVCAECGNYRYKITMSKEYTIKMFLKSHDIKFIHNKAVHLDGSLCRPDFLIDAAFGKIILECDEFQHKWYESYNEQNRMKLIYEDIRLLSREVEVLFIRYNPDNYKGVQYDENAKLEYLHFLLKHFMMLEKLNIKLGVIYLFYDEFNGNPLLEKIEI